MRRFVLALLLSLVAPFAHAVQEVRGTTPGGAAYVMAVPDGWQPGGKLVFVNHGFNFELDDDPGLGPLRDVQLAEGYAVVASGFRERGWALFHALEDNAELLAAFRARFGEPGQVLLFGGSMGGLVSLKQAEDPRFRAEGVYALCPPAAGARTWDAALDLRLAYDAVCAAIPDSQLPLGSAPFTWLLDLADIPLDLGDFTQGEAVFRALARIVACTGLYLPTNIRSSGQRARLAQLESLSGIDDEDFLKTNFAYAIFALSDVVRAPEKLNDRNPFDTRGVSFDLGPLEGLVPRFAPDPFAALDFARSSTLSGGGNAKILSMHTTRDQLVVPAHQAALAALYPADRLAQFVVNEDTPTHCGFTAPEFLSGWESLRAWVAGGTKPVGATLQSTCRNLVTSGTATGECRIADYVRDDAALDVAFNPRPQVRTGEASARVAGLWFTPGRSGEGLFLEPQPDGRVIVSWYTFPRAGEPGEQLWLFGEGRITGNGLQTDYLIRTSGGAFGGAFDPRGVQQVPYGTLRIVFEGDAATMRYEGPGGNFTRPLARLSRFIVPPRVEGQPFLQGSWQFSGGWYDPQHPGEGLFLHTMLDRPERFAFERLFLVWYTYDEQGRSAWLFAEGGPPIDLSPPPLFGYEFRAVLQPVGTRFGDDFREGDVQRRVVGRIFLQAQSCSRINLSFTPDPGSAIPARQLSWQRLSQPADGYCTFTP